MKALLITLLLLTCLSCSDTSEERVSSELYLLVRKVENLESKIDYLEDEIGNLESEVSSLGIEKADEFHDH